MPDDSTYKELKKKAAKFDRLMMDYRRIQEEVRRIKETAKENALQLESVFEHSNLMAMEAQVAILELKQVFNTSTDGMWVVDKDFKIRLINKALLSIFDKEDVDVVNKNCYDLLAVSSCHSDSCPLTRVLKGEKHIEFDINITDNKQTNVPCILSASPFFGLDGKVIGMVAGFKDITERKQAEIKLKKLNRKLERLATIDSLTQVSNRREFNRYLNQEWFRHRRNRRPFSLIMCDVDFFKGFNDAYGHSAGDDCLFAVAQAIRSNLKRAPDFVARYGGEEFVVILPETDAKGALHVAESIRRQVFTLGIEHNVSAVAPVVTISLGVSTIVPEGTIDPEFFVNTADKALYQAKSKGRNQTAFQSPGEQNAASHLSVVIRDSMEKMPDGRFRIGTD